MNEPTAQDRPHQGDIYYVDLPDSDPFGKNRKHRVIVVSHDHHLERGTKAMVVPLTTKRAQERKRYSWSVYFRAGEFEGIERDCVARCEHVTTIDMDEYLDFQTGRLGAVDESTIEKLADAVRSAICLSSRSS